LLLVLPTEVTPPPDAPAVEQEFAVAYDYDTVDRDLEQIGMTVSRLPAEAGVVWRLRLPRGEVVEEWEPGTAGLTPPQMIAELLEGVVARKPLVPAPPLSGDAGAIRLREMLEAQRHALLVHEPGTRLDSDPENLHQHRVAARRTRAFLRAARRFVDPEWRRSLAEPLGRLGELTGPVRDLDVLLAHLRDEAGTLAEPDRRGAEQLIARLEHERSTARRPLLEGLDDDGYLLLLARLRFPPRLADGIDAIPLEQIARQEFARLARRVAKLGTQPDAAALHGLRIALKRARYTAELAAPRTKPGRRFLARAKALQDILGEHQDAVIAEQRLRSSAVTDAHTAAAFVAGRLAERQLARRTRALEQLPRAWSRVRKAAERIA
jgi:CHAD domain-containing protein